MLAVNATIHSMIKSAAESDFSKVDWIPTGLSNLDKILGGGIPTKRIIEISGSWGLGKTTLALTIIASAQKEGYKTLWCDQEWAWEGQYAEVLGVNLNKVGLLQERLAETALDEIEAYAEKEKNAVIVIDAIGALLPRAEAEKDNASKTIGGQAGLVAKFCRKITPSLAINNNALIVINHEYVDIMSARIMTSGGAKLQYAKSVAIRLKNANKKIMSGENKVGQVVTIEVKKNKLAPTMGQETELEMIYGQGWNKSSDLVQTALDKGLITKQGQFFFFKGEKVARGQNGLREKFKDEVFANQIHEALKTTS